MIPKLENALQAVDAGVREVVITADSEIDNPQAGTHVVGTQA
jgi:acetylglutamate kinase